MNRFQQCDMCKGSGLVKCENIICTSCNGKKCIYCKSTGYKRHSYIECYKCYSSGIILPSKYTKEEFKYYNKYILGQNIC